MELKAEVDLAPYPGGSAKESNKWNWKFCGIYIALFTGISLSESNKWNWKCKRLAQVPNGFGVKESNKWNWKRILGFARFLIPMTYESNKWNWKFSLSNSARLEIPILNPINGIERVIIRSHGVPVKQVRWNPINGIESETNKLVFWF